LALRAGFDVNLLIFGEGSKRFWVVSIFIFFQFFRPFPFFDTTPHSGQDVIWSGFRRTEWGDSWTAARQWRRHGRNCHLPKERSFETRNHDGRETRRWGQCHGWRSAAHVMRGCRDGRWLRQWCIGRKYWAKNLKLMSGASYVKSEIMSKNLCHLPHGKEDLRKSRFGYWKKATLSLASMWAAIDCLCCVYCFVLISLKYQ